MDPVVLANVAAVAACCGAPVVAAGLWMLRGRRRRSKETEPGLISENENVQPGSSDVT